MYRPLLTMSIPKWTSEDATRPSNPLNNVTRIRVLPRGSPVVEGARIDLYYSRWVLRR